MLTIICCKLKYNMIYSINSNTRVTTFLRANICTIKRTDSFYTDQNAKRTGIYQVYRKKTWYTWPWKESEIQRLCKRLQRWPSGTNLEASGIFLRSRTATRLTYCRNISGNPWASRNSNSMIMLCGTDFTVWNAWRFTHHQLPPACPYEPLWQRSPNL